MRPTLLRQLAVLLMLSILLMAGATSAQRHHRRQRPEQMRGDGQLLHPSDDGSGLNAWRAARGMAQVGGAFGIDISIGVNVTSFQCLVENGFSFVVQRLWRSLCEVDSAAVASIDAAWKGGMSQVDVYFYPACGCALTPEQQVQQALAAVEGHKFGTFWFDIETADSGWTDPATNLAWVQRAVNQAVSQLGTDRVGVYSNAHNWAIVMGGNTTHFATLPIWYAHYDQNPSFSDFVPFGPWNYPVAKQFNDGPDVCGVSCDHDWVPL